MSLHQLANQMQSAGRGEDKVLVHMTPGEVGSLQTLAMKHGGSLTINPNTGLPEAGFLSSLLPTILGLGLAPFTGGMSAALLVGGGYTLATGSLKKGLMAGLGAYGGAGLGSSLSSLGAGAAGTGIGAGGAAIPGVMGAPAATAATAATPALGGSIMAGAPTSALGTGFASSAPNLVASPLVAATAAPAQLTAASQALQIPTAAPTTYANMGQGLSKLNSLDALKTFGKDNVMNIGASLAPMMVPDKLKVPKQNQGMIRPYTFDRSQNPDAYAQGEVGGMTRTPVYGQPFDSSERMFFNDQYTAGTPYAAPGPEYKATGGLTALAMGGSVGGPVEDMSAQNSMSQNTGYPMANLQTPVYSNPQMQRPIAGNVISASGDAPVDPYTGEARFAEGGNTTQNYTFNPQTQQFTRIEPKVEAPKAVQRNPMGGMMNTGVINRAAAEVNNVPVGAAISGGVVNPYVQQAAPQYGNYQQAPQMQQAQRPDDMADFYEYMRNQMNGMQGFAAGGGVSHLGDYSDGGRLLRGPGDGVSDDIPAQIGDKQPARLADGEFVIPARIVSELGNGSTEAGARQLYKMMERVQQNRRKSVGKGKVAVDAKSANLLPA